jgi:putative SOS response-associated peptidase YedK
MCGRFTQKAERKLIALEFYVQDFLSNVFETYNLAPGQDAGVIIHEDVNRYARYRWGLVPFWAKDPSIGNRMINARGETVMEKTSFKKSFAARRCLVPADGFYEWRKDGSHKTPFYIYHVSKKPMSFAGLWEVWHPKGGKGELKKPDSATDSAGQDGEPEALHTFTIITTEANDKLRALHDRMPVIIQPDKRGVWLNRESDPARLVELLKPLPSDQIEFHEVSRMVNSPKNNRPECIEPAALED